MKCCVSFEGNVVDVCEVSDGKWPKCVSCLMFMPSSPVELLFVLFEIANCTFVGKLYFLGGKGLDCLVNLPVDFVCGI